MTPQWTKLKNRFFDDGRIKILRSRPHGNDYAFIFTMMQSLAGYCNCGGGLCIDESIPYTAESLEKELDFKASVIKKAITALLETHLIEIIDGVIFISDWDNEQSAERLEEIRAYEREKKRKYREKQKQSVKENVHGHVPKMSTECPDTEEEKETETEKEKELEEEGEDIYESVKDHFNTATAFQKILFLSDKQKKAIDIALAKYGLELLLECFRMAGESEFLKGKNPKGWTANFDWLINPDNISKVLNGNYSSVFTPSAPPQPADDRLVSSFDTDEFMEAALKRGFADF